MRCPNCQKFVGLTEDEEPEVDAQIDDINVELTVRVFRCCVECGTELKEANFDDLIEIDHDCRGEEDDYRDEEGNEIELTFDLKEVEAVAHSRAENPKSRRSPMLYGAQVDGTVTCSLCGEEIQFSTLLEERAGAFDELS